MPVTVQYGPAVCLCSAFAAVALQSPFPAEGGLECTHTQINTLIMHTRHGSAVMLISV